MSGTITPACPICGNIAGNRIHRAREMMFGLRDAFDYVECGDCGCLHLADPPADMSRYYPSGYYSYHGSPRRRLPGFLEDGLRRARARAWFGRRDPLGLLLLRLLGPTTPLRWMKAVGADFDSAILDVGCGAGELLQELRRDGFGNLTGADPYLDADRRLGPGLALRRAGLEDLDGKWDVVMFHHSFEHLADPEGALRRAADLLPAAGRVLIRVPVASCRAWRDYGADWVQLDAPRHIFLHTDRSMELLAGRTGFELVSRGRDSTAFQFWGSEQYRRDIPLRDPRSHAVDPAGSPWSSADIARLEGEARRLNEAGEGDQAWYILRRRDQSRSER